MKRLPGFVLLTLVLIALGAGCAAANQAETVSTGTVDPEAATAVTFNSTATPELIKPTEVPPKTSGAGNADVLYVAARETAVGLWTFAVEVAHPDTGWEDYADGWDVVLPDGTIAKASPDAPFTRLLLHPHENEQPFTRSQSNIPIPPEVTTVTVRAHDLVDGFGGQVVMVDLTAVSGGKYEVTRLDP